MAIVSPGLRAWGVVVAERLMTRMGGRVEQGRDPAGALVGLRDRVYFTRGAPLVRTEYQEVVVQQPSQCWE